MEATGKRKLSKRFGAKPVLEYRDQGFLPEAMINFMATIGWNDGTDQEIYSVQEIIEKFSLDRVQKSGGVFDEQRLIWMNGVHIRNLSLDELYKRSEGFWPDTGDASDDYKKKVLGLVHERLKFLSELPSLTSFFFSEPEFKDEIFTENKQLKKLSADQRKTTLAAVTKELEASDFSLEDLENRLRKLVQKLETKPGILFGLVRAAITGSNVAPGLFETMNVLGKDKVISRIGKLI
jgi:glutamyl-tRNA synthetase